ncbi:hypothetical protein HMPREF9104_02029 [Lentilactobacillus kisonensis F0435]|uniref:Uncharacterized protein n=1 Tax=Lentilactobacillus kisonensis F0435 TaxID=797516 RepID=H1LHD8_9LACO|nr:hypothetical protein HMPREF9104_02029 [Lentilactobacillus kisonensis F0435]
MRSDPNLCSQRNLVTVIRVQLSAWCSTFSAIMPKISTLI